MVWAALSAPSSVRGPACEAVVPPSPSPKRPNVQVHAQTHTCPRAVLGAAACARTPQTAVWRPRHTDLGVACLGIRLRVGLEAQLGDAPLGEHAGKDFLGSATKDQQPRAPSTKAAGRRCHGSMGSMEWDQSMGSMESMGTFGVRGRRSGAGHVGAEL